MRLRPDLPAAVWDVIARALRPVGAERFAHAGLLRAALRQAVAPLGLSSPSLVPWSAPAVSASTPPPTVLHDDLARAPTVASQPDTPRAAVRSADPPPADEGVPWGRLLGFVALAAVLLALALVALLVALDAPNRPQGAPDRSPPRAPPRLAAAAFAMPGDAAVRDFLARWERARARRAGADALDRVYATSLKYHGSARPPDFAQMARDLDRTAALGGSFAYERSRTEWAEEPLEADAVPSACRLVQGAEGPVVKVRAWVTELRPDRNADIGCPRLEGLYVLRLRAIPAGLRVCHETWSVDEGICASCPTAPLCQRRP